MSIYIHWGDCACPDCGRRYHTPLDGFGRAAQDHEDCPEHANAENSKAQEVKVISLNAEETEGAQP